ncbi:MAG: alpha-amylase family glycosyl hydrolase, partial [Flavisolibacter sp.]
MPATVYPSLYQVNIRVWLTELSGKLGRTATLDDIPDSEIDTLVTSGFDWIWLLSVWQTGNEGLVFSRTNPHLRKEFRETLTDLKEADIQGSGFAITAYTVHQQLGGDEALARLRKRLQDRGLKLMLDFVPNHTSIDHHWVKTHPEYYIRGTEALLKNEPENYRKINTGSTELILAHGRDPFFSGWADTLQLNYSKNDLQNALIKELIKISDQCDGIRCDMAMLVIPEVFENTWGLPCKSFWPEAILTVKEYNPHFTFMAEVYWDLEWKLQQLGFDYTYDKKLYDYLKSGHAKPVHDHLHAELNYQQKMARFLENHDEKRAAAEFPDDKHKAAAVISFLTPGLRFFHQGQFEGKKKKISPHLVRGPVELVNQDLQSFYKTLLNILQQPLFHLGKWKMADSSSAWNGNGSYENFVCFSWEIAQENKRVFVTVNYSSERSQCYVKLPFPGIKNKTIILRDLFSNIIYERDGDELLSNGLYL